MADDPSDAEDDDVNSATAADSASVGGASSGSMEDVGDDDAQDVQDTPDGGALVDLGDDDEPAASGEHFDNLAETLPQGQLDDLASELLDLIEQDRDSRKKRDERYAEGIKRTGLGNDAPGGAEFEGASTVVHPMLTKVCIDFSARAMKELFPANGPVKAKITGNMTSEKYKKSLRKTQFMNWQLTEDMPEFRPELEQLLTQEPLGGAQYMKMYWDKRLGRTVSEFIPIDDIYLPFSASSYLSAERKTHAQRLTELEFGRRVRSKQYVDVDSPAGQSPDETASRRATDKVEGREDGGYNEDGVRLVYKVNAVLDIEDEDDFKPYIVEIDDTTRRICAVYRNWAEGSNTFEALEDTVEFVFVPWRGAQGIGIIHMIGGLSAAATGALRALLDSAHINNFPTAMKLQGGGKGGQTLNLQPTQIHEIEGALTTDDIRKTVMPLPFNQPSPVLMELLGFLVAAGEDLIKTTFEDLADQKQDMPVGTTLALIEQGMTVFSAIHARHHASMARLLKIQHRLNRDNLTDKEIRAKTGEQMCRVSDFEGPLDVIPVSDPNIFSEIQRQSQVALIAQRAQNMAPFGLYDLRKVEQRILEQAKIPNADDLLTPLPKPTQQNAVNENLTAMMGKPITAFPDQDHEAHMNAHADFMTSPLFGQSQLIGPKLTPILLQHLVEHLGFWYVGKVEELSSAATGHPITKFMDKDPDVQKELDGLMDDVSAKIVQGAPQALRKVMAAIQAAQQFMASMQPPMPQDPRMATAAAQQAETQRKSKADQAEQQLDQQRLTIEQQRAQADQKRNDDDAQLRQAEIAQRGEAEQARTEHQQMQLVVGSHEKQQSEQAAMQKAVLDTHARMTTDVMREQAATARHSQTDDTQRYINDQDNEMAWDISEADNKAAAKQAKFKNGNGLSKSVNPTPKG